MNRGVLYVVWDGRGRGLTNCGRMDYRPLLERSVASVQKHLPGVPVKVVQADPELGLLNKARARDWAPWDSALLLDADTVVLGDLSHAWEKAERFGMACCVGQCPWLRRYGAYHNDSVEYNSGVIFFTREAGQVFERWKQLGPYSTPSRFLQGDVVCGLEVDDQLAFSKAIEDVGFNPHVLPKNYNLMPGWDTRFFTPAKIWHSIHPVPPGLEEESLAASSGRRLIRFCGLGGDEPRAG